LLAPVEVPDLPFGFRRIECWNGFCLQRRPGVCAAPQRGSEINEYLQRTGN
jgi:hypothetical protein